ncbi:MAG: TRAP transporter permease [Desulfovibrio sp.]|nr:TRAP transporter permease [Desulfovibrio sp.]
MTTLDTEKKRTQEQELLQQFGEEPDIPRKTLLGAAATATALCWSLFQLATECVILIDAIYVRAIHLAFGLLLLYLTTPLIRSKGNRNPGFFRRCTALDAVLGIAASLCAVYIVLDYEGISQRSGLPTGMDIAVGLTLVVLLLEATRRAIGPALPVIATLFIAYVFSGPHLPDFIAFKGASLSRFVSQISMDTEGIYGVPLQVSSSVVFLFVLFGTMLNKAGGGRFFINLAVSVLGRFRGGAAKAAVLGSAFSGMVSGSSIANVVTAGTFTIPLMKRVGYPAEKAAAIEVAASINGQIAPPVMGAAAFIMAEYVGLPYLDICKAAAIPAFAAYAGLFWITHVEACKLGLKGLPKDQTPDFWSTLKAGAHYLLPLFVLLWELVYERHSPQLAVLKSIAVLTVILVGQPLVLARLRGTSLAQALKEGCWQLFDSLVAGAANMVGVALATASAGIIVGCVSLGLGQQITTFVEVLSGGSVFLLLLITAVASLLLGMGLPTTANYIIMASLTAPVLVDLASGLQIHGLSLALPLIAAHLYCFYFGILADDTPPVGLAAYAGAAIAKCSPIATGIQGFFYDIRTAVLPAFFIFNHDILLWNIDSIPVAVFIFLMTVAGCMAFASLTQGWFMAKNNLFDMLLLCTGTLLMLYPFALTGFFLPYEERWWGYAAGLGVLGLCALMQTVRSRSRTGRPAAARA